MQSSLLLYSNKGQAPISGVMFYSNERLCNNKIFKNQNCKALIKWKLQADILGQWFLVALGPEPISSWWFGESQTLGNLAGAEWGAGRRGGLGGGRNQKQCLFLFQTLKRIVLCSYRAACKYTSHLPTAFHFSHDVLSFRLFFNVYGLLTLEI